MVNPFEVTDEMRTIVGGAEGPEERERERVRERVQHSHIDTESICGYSTGHNVNTILWSGNYKHSTVWSNTNIGLCSNNTHIVPKRSETIYCQ